MAWKYSKKVRENIGAESLKPMSTISSTTYHRKKGQRSVSRGYNLIVTSLIIWLSCDEDAIGFFLVLLLAQRRFHHSCYRGSVTISSPKQTMPPMTTSPHNLYVPLSLDSQRQTIFAMCGHDLYSTHQVPSRMGCNRCMVAVCKSRARFTLITPQQKIWIYLRLTRLDSGSDG